MDSGILMTQDSIPVCSPDPRIPHTGDQADLAIWLFALEHAMHLLNIMPTKGVEDCTN
jgi:hypothetical protein